MQVLKDFTSLKVKQVRHNRLSDWTRFLHGKGLQTLTCPELDHLARDFALVSVVKPMITEHMEEFWWYANYKVEEMFEQQKVLNYFMKMCVLSI